MADSKQQRVLTGTVGAHAQFRNNEDKGQWNGNKVYPWWVPGKWQMYTKGGYNQTMSGGHQYWICSNSSKTNHEGLRFNHKDDIFSLNSKKRSDFSKSSSSSISYINKGGYNFAFNNCVDTSSDKNGFAYSVTTENDDFSGGSPMPVVGVCFRLFADGNGIYNAGLADEAVCGNGARDKTWSGEASEEQSTDYQINRMHLVYKNYDSGVVFSHPILPEGNNAGDYQFYDKSKWTKGNSIKKLVYDRKACNSEKAILIRAWHLKELPKNSVFIGFTLHLFQGRHAKVNKIKSCHIGGMTPILEGDREILTSAGKNKQGGHQCVAWQPPITSRIDLDDRFDRKKQGQKLVLFDDPGGNNNGTNTSYAPIGGNWKRSINVRDNSAVFKYK